MLFTGCGTNTDDNIEHANTNYEVHYFNGVDIEVYSTTEMWYYDTNRIKIKSNGTEIMLNGSFKVIYK